MVGKAEQGMKFCGLAVGVTNEQELKVWLHTRQLGRMDHTPRSIEGRDNVKCQCMLFVR